MKSKSLCNSFFPLSPSLLALAALALAGSFANPLHAVPRDGASGNAQIEPGPGATVVAQGMTEPRLLDRQGYAPSQGRAPSLTVTLNEAELKNATRAGQTQLAALINRRASEALRRQGKTLPDARLKQLVNAAVAALAGGQTGKLTRLTCVNPGTPSEDCWNLIVW